MIQNLDWLMLISFLLAFLVSRVLIPSILGLLTDAGFVRPNFRGDQIPVGAGFLFFLSILIPTGFLFLMDASVYKTSGLIYLFAVGTMTLLGMADDVFGSRADSGLKGHLKKLLKGQLTTGGLKLVAGGLMAFIVAIVVSDEWLRVVIKTLVVALSVNAINLLDLRPGRAGKGYLLGTLLLLLGGWPSQDLIWVVITAGALLAYLPTDLGAKAMMGDTGSNALGATIGITAALVLPQQASIGYLVVLILFHLFTEKYSLTKVIEKNKMLNYLDQLGRH